MADPRDPAARRPGGTVRRSSRVEPARMCAFEVLRGVSQDDAYANLLLSQRIAEHGLSGRDAAFATELSAGTLRRRGTYDAVLAACARRPVTKIDPPVLDVLRLGAHQLLGMRVASHAAVTTSVELARSQAGQSATGFVNAVLRKAGEHSFDEWVRRIAPDPGVDRAGFLALAHAHPRWMVEELAAALGDRDEELPELLAADNEAPRVTLVARPGLATVEELAGAPSNAQPGGLSPWAATMPAGDPGQISAVAEGRAAVQDEGSQLVALALTRAGVSCPDDLWLDLCAGPGGKAALLGAVAAQRGARLVATELQPHRADLVRRAVRALPPHVVQVETADGLDPPWDSPRFARALVDAPCSGLGALRRRPESRWRRTPADVDALVPLQRRLLSSALDSVLPGGVVVYATCSPVLAETAGVVEGLLAERPDVRLEPASALLPEVADAEGPLPGTVQLWPHRHGTDAMFVAVLRRLGT